ncbi:MAG: hypothetical protein JWL68_691 [Actinomycetia bacterium]|nr:hypothetical protein [Actinomycetes bacterium]
MTDAWMPGAERLTAAADGGRLKGGAPRAVWLVLHADPMTVSVREAAEDLIELGRPAHLVWNPLSGEVAQLIPVVRAGRALGWADGPHGTDEPDWTQDPDWMQNTSWTHGADWTQGTGWTHGPGQRQLAAATGRPRGEPTAPPARDGLAGVNNEGRVCVQIGVIGHAWAPFTDGPVRRARDIVSWLDSWHVGRGWPAGRPAPCPGSIRPGHQWRRNWARGGHFGASQVPGCRGAGPGSVDIERLTGPFSAQRGTPAPRAPGSAARISAMTRPPRLAAARSAAP